jgi:hypothetical protein
MAHGVINTPGAVKLHSRMHGGTIDAGVRSVARVEAPRPKLRPPLWFRQRRVMIDRPSEQWTEPPSDIAGSLGAGDAR